MTLFLIKNYKILCATSNSITVIGSKIIIIWKKFICTSCLGEGYPSQLYKISPYVRPSNNMDNSVDLRATFLSFSSFSELSSSLIQL